MKSHYFFEHLHKLNTQPISYQVKKKKEEEKNTQYVLVFGRFHPILSLITYWSSLLQRTVETLGIAVPRKDQEESLFLKCVTSTTGCCSSLACDDFFNLAFTLWPLMIKQVELTQMWWWAAVQRQSLTAPPQVELRAQVQLLLQCRCCVVSRREEEGWSLKDPSFLSPPCGLPRMFSWFQ